MAGFHKTVEMLLYQYPINHTWLLHVNITCINLRIVDSKHECHIVSHSQTFSSFTLGQEEKGSDEHSIELLLAYPISHLKGFLCAASGMLVSLNDINMLACNLEKDDKVVRNAWPTNTANTISHHCSLISQSIQVSCNLF